MKIQDSNVMMASKRSYRQGSTTTRGSRTGVDNLLSGTNNEMNLNLNWGDLLSLGNGEDPNFFAPNYTRDGLIVGNEDGYPSPQEMHVIRMDMVESAVSRMRSVMSGGMTTTSTYYEEESTSFSASGQICTEDGRTIDFNIELTMTRSFMQQTRISMPSLLGAFMDPLVINTGAAISKMSDQKFLFDLDGDGNEEYISMPVSGSAFLALDKNGDGIINDGNELFGAGSGDGFGDLRAYDSDGNGWIDENDEIFDKLKVWYKDENGKDVLMNLKEADIGAIYLGEQSTDFSLMGSDFNENGMIRSTGFFLRESGGAGIIQHVDLKAESELEHLINQMRKLSDMLLGNNTDMSNVTEVRSTGLAFSLNESSETILAPRTERTEVKSESDKKDQEALDRVDKLCLQRRQIQARIKKHAEERRKERKDFLEAELERLREHRSEEEARLEALFGERETIAEGAMENEVSELEEIAV